MNRRHLIYIFNAFAIIFIVASIASIFFTALPPVTEGPVGVVVGDSIARGTAQSRLQRAGQLELANQYGSFAYQLENVTGWTWYNQAINNANTTNLLDRWDRDVLGESVHAVSYYPYIPDTTLPKKPLHAVVIIGRNDIIEGRTTSFITDNIALMARKARENGVNATFCTIPPASDLNISALIEVNDWIRTQLPKEGVRVWDAYTFFNDPRRINVMRSEYRGRDFIHPNDDAVDQAALALWMNLPLEQDTATTKPIGVVIGDNVARGRNQSRLQSPVNLDAPNEYGCFAHQFENVTGWVWYNHAISNANTTNLLDRWDRDALGASMHTARYYEGIPNTTLPKRPACVVLLVGRNDLAEGLSTSFIEKNLEQLAQRTQQAGIKAAFCTIPPAAGIDDSRVAEVNTWMKTHLRRYGVVVWDADSYFAGDGTEPAVYDDAGRLRPSSAMLDQAALALWQDCREAFV